MASEVDICNLALAHLGDNATVASIDPPEGSAQAEQCARFYRVARDTLLEMHTWGFATRRARLALLGSDWSEWKYAYQGPSDMMNAIAVLAPDAADDYSVNIPVPYSNSGTVNTGQGIYTPQPYTMESDEDGNPIIYTNQVDAVLRYTAFVTDTTTFSPLFVSALSWHLAGYLAGPILKGDVGAAEAKRCAGMAMSYMARATASDANQRRLHVQQSTPWMVNR